MLTAERLSKRAHMGLKALLGNIDVLITWLMNANYITAYLMPEMPIVASREFSSVHFYSAAFMGKRKILIDMFNAVILNTRFSIFMCVKFH